VYREQGCSVGGEIELVVLGCQSVYDCNTAVAHEVGVCLCFNGKARDFEGMRDSYSEQSVVQCAMRGGKGGQDNPRCRSETRVGRCVSLSLLYGGAKVIAARNSRCRVHGG